VGRHATPSVTRRDRVPAARSSVVADVRDPRTAWALPVLAFLASCAVVGVNAAGPYSNAYAAEVIAPTGDTGPTQTLVVASGDSSSVTRDGFEVEAAPEPEPEPVVEAASASSTGVLAAPVAGTPDPGSAQAIAADMVAARGWGGGEFNCLVSLWNKESGWNVYAANRSSGAYGIPQALPGSKMASAGADWQTNPATQISWGLGYISGRYGTPCGAWAHSQSVGWY
jgi:hypothetical protein